MPGITLSEVIDRFYRDYLYPADEQPATGRLDANIATTVATTFTYSTKYWTLEELDSIGAGTIVEIDRELFRVAEIDDVTRTITVSRGALGTTAAVHTAGARIVLRPKYPRATVFEMLSDAIEDLNGDLYAIAVSDTFTTVDSLIEVPADVAEILKVMYRTYETSTTRYVDGAFEFLEDVNTDVSTTGKALQLSGVPTSRTAYYVYRTWFTRPDDETYDLTDDAPNFETRWIELILLNALISMMAAADIPARTQEFITEALETQGFPVGAGETLDRALVRIFEYRLQRAKRRLYRDAPMRLVIHR
jgi:hypothetical protein